PISTDTELPMHEENAQTIRQDLRRMARGIRGFTLLTTERRRRIVVSGHVDDDYLRNVALLLDQHPDLAAAAILLSTSTGLLLRYLPPVMNAVLGALAGAAVLAMVQAAILARYQVLHASQWRLRTFIALAVGLLAIRLCSVDPWEFGNDEILLVLILALAACAGVMVGVVQHRTLRNARIVPWWPAFHGLLWMLIMPPFTLPIPAIPHLVPFLRYFLFCGLPGLLLAVALGRPPRASRQAAWYAVTFILTGLLAGFALLAWWVSEEQQKVGPAVHADAIGGGDIGGFVAATDGRLPGVSVEVSGAGKTREAITDVDGEYQVTGLQPGIYEVTAMLSGFNTPLRKRVLVMAGALTPVNVTLIYGTNPSVVHSSPPYVGMLLLAVAIGTVVRYARGGS
ncbi:MAG TPA: carboxypeptidase-like regulatory domain-containing protein, partial [Thermoanaerobaculia bacterium]|nr:carboxypeptidase-like regulatory domain-containing protein [Thermoanaerobaculia bacterium]